MIRAILPSDQKLYLELCREFYQSSAVLHPVPETHFMRTFYALASGSPYAAGYFLGVDGQIAGYALLAKTFSQEVGGVVWWIEELYIRPQFQGRGLGTEFFRYLSQIRPPEVKRFRLEIEPDNQRAEQLYQRLGFQRLGYGQMVQDFTA